MVWGPICAAVLGPEELFMATKMACCRWFGGIDFGGSSIA